jgi:hypothetical protein
LTILANQTFHSKTFSFSCSPFCVPLSDPFSILLCENMTRWQTKSDHHFVIYIFPPPLFINRNDSSYRELHGWLSTTILMRRRRVVSVFNRISIHPGVERDESDQRRGLITMTTACVYTWILSSEEEAVDSSYFFVLRPSPPAIDGSFPFAPGSYTRKGTCLYTRSPTAAIDIIY